MMRIAVEGTSVAPGGGLSVLRGAVRALAERGDVTLDVFVQPGLSAEDFGPRARTIVAGPFRGLPHRMAWVQSMFPALARHHDAVFAPGNLAPLPLASRTVLYVQNAHVVPQSEWRAEYRRGKRRLQRLMARLSIRRAVRVLFVSEALKQWARPYWELNRHEPGVARPGVPLALDRLPRRCPGRDVLMVGNLVPHKRVDRAVRGFALLARERGRPGRLRIAGGESSPAMGNSLRDAAVRAGILDRVEFLGFLGAEPLMQAYAASGCYLSTSALEALPLPVLEAMAVGTPVVVPDSPVFREVCGGAGIYFGDDDEAIARGLGDALDEPLAPEEIRRVGRERLAAFSWPLFAERVGSAFAAVRYA
jgi:glycosyltransferase involved in cell wall biosynthesis